MDKISGFGFYLGLDSDEWKKTGVECEQEEGGLQTVPRREKGGFFQVTN